MRATFRLFKCVALLIGSQAIACSQLTIDATSPSHENDRQVRSGHFGSIGRILPIRTVITTHNGQVDAKSTVIEFTLTNSGKESLNIPISPNFKDLVPTQPGAAYSVKHLRLYITSDKKQESMLDGGADLYGNQEAPSTLCDLGPGKSIRVLARVGLSATEAMKETSDIFVAHTVLNRETIKPVHGEAVMDTEEIGSAISSEYTPASLFQTDAGPR